MPLPPRQADCHPDKRHIAFGLCRTCYSREWYKDHADYYIEKGKRYHSDPRRRFAYRYNQLARKLGWDGELDWRLMSVGDCSYCGTPCTSWDHVIPLSQGGTNTNANLVPCCMPCNMSKSMRTPEQWAANERIKLPKVRVYPQRKKKAA